MAAFLPRYGENANEVLWARSGPAIGQADGSAGRELLACQGAAPAPRPEVRETTPEATIGELLASGALSAGLAASPRTAVPDNARPN